MYEIAYQEACLYLSLYTGFITTHFIGEDRGKGGLHLPIIEVKELTKIFGNDPKRALPLPAQSRYIGTLSGATGRVALQSCRALPCLVDCLLRRFAAIVIRGCLFPVQFFTDM